jgi:hypothetical protein
MSNILIAIAIQNVKYFDFYSIAVQNVEFGLLWQIRMSKFGCYGSSCNSIIAGMKSLIIDSAKEEFTTLLLIA